MKKERKEKLKKAWMWTKSHYLELGLGVLNITSVVLGIVKNQDKQVEIDKKQSEIDRLNHIITEQSGENKALFRDKIRLERENKNLYVKLNRYENE